MSDIDKRVVQMEFDNSKFDKNVKKSTATLSKFEEQLKFEDVSDSLNVVKKGFSGLEIAGITAITRITNAIINLGVKIVKSLSIDQISSGWQKFGDKTIAIATLAAQKIIIAGKELDNYSEKMEGITEQLEKLEWFTNETSYTFNDMVAALGKFTAAGQDLDKSVNAMEGIATWAAMSGANAYKASSAMTQLAQTLGRGYVLRIDWQSIQTLNMDTAMFREQVLNTAVELGKLKKVGNEFITNTGKKITSVNFTETLASKWFTSDILVKTLEKYAAAVQDIYEISEREGLSARQVIEKYGDSLDEFGVKAFKAAQETRTLGEALTYVFGTIGSSWSKTFELIVGSYDDAKTVWSDLSDALYEDVIASNDFRNEILKTWKELGGQSDLFKHGEEDQGVFWNIYDSIVAIKKIFTSAKEAIFPKSIFEDESEQAKELGERFKLFTSRLKEHSSQMLKNIKENETFTNILKGVYSIIKIIMLSLQGIYASIDPIIQISKSLISDIFARLGIFGDKLSKIEGIEETIAGVSNRLSGIIQKILDMLNPRGVLNAIFEVIYDIKEAISDVKPLEQLEKIFDSFTKALEESGGTEENFGKISEGLISIIKILGKIISQVISLISKYVLPIVNSVASALGTITGVLSGILTSVLALVLDFFTTLNKLLDGNKDSISSFGGEVKEFLTDLPSKLKALEPILESLINIITNVIDIILLIPKMLDNISKALTGRSIVENIQYMFETIAKALKTFKSAIESDTIDEKNNLLSPLLSIIQGLVSIAQGILSILKPLVTLVGQIMNVVGNIFKAIGEFLQDVVDGTWRDYKTITKVVLGIIAVAGVIALAVTAIRWLGESFHALINPLGYAAQCISEGIYFIGDALRLNAYANLMRAFASSLLLFAVSVMLIGKMPINELTQGAVVIGAFAVILGVLIVSLTKLATITETTKANNIQRSLFGGEKITKGSKTKTTHGGLGSIASIIDGIAISMLVLALSIRMLGKLSPEQIQQGSSVITKFSLIISGLLIAISLIMKETKAKAIGKRVNDKGLFNISKILNSISLMLLSLATSLKMISKLSLNPDALNSASKIIYTMMGMIAVMIAVTNITAKKAKGSEPSMQTLPNLIKSITTMLLALTISLLVLTSIANKDAKNGSEGLKKAIEVILIIMAAIAVLIAVINLTSKNVTKDIKRDVSAKLGGTIFAISLLLLSMASAVAIIAAVAKNNLNGVIAGVAAMALFMAEILILFNIITNDKNTVKNAKAISAVLLIAISISVMLLAFAGAMKMLLNIPVKEMIKQVAILIVLIASLSLLSTIGNGIGMVSMAASMILLGVSLGIFAKNLQKLNNVNWKSIGKGLLLLGGGLAILALASIVAPGITLLCVGILALGAGLLFAGIGMEMLASSLILFSTSVVENGTLIKDSILTMVDAMFEGIKEFIRKLLQFIPESLLLLLESIVEFLPKTLELLGNIIVQITEFLVKMMPTFVELFTTLINGLLQVLINTTPKLIELLFTIIMSVLQNLAENIGTIGNYLVDIILGLIDVIIQRTPDIVNKIIELVYSIVYNLTVAIPKLIKTIFQAIWDAIQTLFPGLADKIKAGLSKIGDWFKETFSKIGDFFKGIGNWFKETATKFVNWQLETKEKISNWFKDVGSKIGNWFKDKTAQFAKWQEETKQKIANWFKDAWQSIIDWFKKVGDKFKQGWQDFKNWGKNLIENFKAGIKEKWDAFIKWWQEKWDNFKKKFKEFFGIKSPSKVFEEYGGYIVEGLENGIDDEAETAEEGMAQLAEGLTNTFTDLLDIHSPSKLFRKFGNYLIQGLDQGIEEEGTKAIDTISDTISKITNYVSDNLDSDDMTIKPVLDLSDVNKGVNDIHSLMSGISGKDISMSGKIALNTSRAIERQNSKSVAESRNQNVVTNEGDNYYNTWNITTNDPEEFAKEADKILQKLRVRSNLAKGGAR